MSDSNDIDFWDWNFGSDEPGEPAPWWPFETEAEWQDMMNLAAEGLRELEEREAGR